MRVLIFAVLVLFILLLFLTYFEVHSLAVAISRLEMQNRFLRVEVVRLENRLDSGIKEFYDLHKPRDSFADHGHDPP